MTLITDSLVLPRDVVLIPVADLTPQARAQLTGADSDVAITRPRARTPSKVVDEQAAALIEEFRTPSTIVDAVIRYCGKVGSDPHETLESAFPLFEKFVRQRLLVSPEARDAEDIQPCYSTGMRVAGFVIEQCIQVLEDTELYRARDERGTEVALKIARPCGGHDPAAQFEREAALLRHLNGSISPLLMAAGNWEECPYLAMEWRMGESAAQVAAGLLSSRHGRLQLHRICGAILQAYAHLHARHVLHSDIHARNLLVTSEGSITIIDFGLGRMDDVASPHCKAPRGGIPFFCEPEYARARLKHRTPPLSSMAGEQYCVATLLYSLLTGANYVDFAAEKETVLRQIVESPCLPFSHHGVASWPEVEAILARALSKEPEQRFASLAEFAAHWQAVEVAATPEPVRHEEVDITPVTQLLEHILPLVGREGPLLSGALPFAPLCSVNMGAAGIAYGLYRIACVRNDPSLLALADIWSVRAQRDMAKEQAFYCAEVELTPEVVAPVSLYHMASGVHCVAAMIAHARGDFMAHQLATEAFLQATEGPCDKIDLTLGNVGLLLGCAFLLDIQPDASVAVPLPVRERGDTILQDIWTCLDAYPPILDCKEIQFLGIAHGWAGLLYATLAWCQAAQTPLPSAFETRLQQLAALAEPMGAGQRWPLKLRGTNGARSSRYMSGWCNGSAGQIHLWTLAHRRFQHPQYLALAEGAGHYAWEIDDHTATLCCGDAGRAYGLLNLYRYTGEQTWLQRARHLTIRAALRAAEEPMTFHSLYKGGLGTALLAADLTQPDRAYMPLFEAAGWAGT